MRSVSQHKPWVRLLLLLVLLHGPSLAHKQVIDTSRCSCILFLLLLLMLLELIVVRWRLELRSMAWDSSRSMASCQRGQCAIPASRRWACDFIEVD